MCQCQMSDVPEVKNVVSIIKECQSMIQTNSCDKYMYLAKTEVRGTLCQSDRAMQESKNKTTKIGVATHCVAVLVSE